MTMGTLPGSYFQRKFPEHLLTVRTGLRRREESSCFNEVSTIPPGFIFQLPEERSPPSISFFPSKPFDLPLDITGMKTL
jgi:hypothetical protein